MTKFLGSCEVCGQTIRNYRSLAGHLRHNTDAEHRALKERWYVWREEYRATLRCRKCGELFEITDKKEKDRKRCPRCEGLRQSMSKKEYEKLSFDKPLDPRRHDANRGSKAGWDGLQDRSTSWERGDSLYKAVVTALEEGERVNDAKTRLGISYKVFRAIGEDAFGKEGYRNKMHSRKAENARRVVEEAQQSNALEDGFADQIRELGWPVWQTVWYTLKIDGQKVKREADIKCRFPNGKKAILLCDGVVFHGPGCLYVDSKKIEEDRQTALAFFELGYTVLRYSETEIHDGTALQHLQQTMERLSSCEKVYRNWAPEEEKVA